MASDTRTKLLTYAEDLEYGRLSIIEVANSLGVSRQRVYQLCTQLQIDFLTVHVCRICGTRLAPDDRDSRYCKSCIVARPKPKGIILKCAECSEVYVLFGFARSVYIQNKKRGIKNARCPSCKDRARGFKEMMAAACSVCGSEFLRQRSSVQRSRKLNNPMYCTRCRQQRIWQSRWGNAAKRRVMANAY